MSKKYQIFLACGLVAATTRLFAASDYVQLQQQVISNDSILKSLQQSQHAYAINQKYAGRLNNPTFNLELDNLGNSDLKDLDGPTTMIGLSQDIPLNNKRALRRQLAGFQGNNNQFEALKRQAELKADFRVCMSNWYAASKRVEIYSTESKMNARQAHVLNEKLKFGGTVANRLT